MLKCFCETIKPKNAPTLIHSVMYVHVQCITNNNYLEYLSFFIFSKSVLVFFACWRECSNASDVSCSRASTPSNLHTLLPTTRTTSQYIATTTNFSRARILGALIRCNVDCSLVTLAFSSWDILRISLSSSN